jgi:hypothetical protein
MKTYSLKIREITTFKKERRRSGKQRFCLKISVANLFSNVSQTLLPKFQAGASAVTIFFIVVVILY